MIDNIVVNLTLWNYLKMNHEVKKAEAIIVFGNYDLLTAYRGIETYHENLAPLWQLSTLLLDISRTLKRII